MKKRLAWIGIPVAAMVIAVSVYLLDRSAPSPDAGALPPARQSEAAPAVRAAPAAPDGGPAASAAEAELLVRSTETTGDLTWSRLRGGDLGYVDAGSIIYGNDPSSIVAFLQAHSELTGADESLEIEIRGISDYPSSITARFNQIIDGKRSPQGQGSVSFDPATGAVISALASLAAPDPALAGNVVILQNEAVAIARAFVTSAVLEEKTVAIGSGSGGVGVRPRLRPGFALAINDVTPKELRYAVDWETNKARVEWPVWISADLGDFTPGISWEVLVDASTGEIVGIRNLDQPYAGVCSDLTYRVFDGSSMDNQQQFPSTRVRGPAAVVGYAMGMTASINEANPDYIGEVREGDCEVDIVINVPDDVLVTLEGYAAGLYQEQWDRILVRARATKATVVHELMHALMKTPYGPVEHGLVTASESLHVGFGWRYAGENYTTKPESMSSDMHAGVAHAIYSISQEVGDDMAFKIVLATDLQRPLSHNAYEVISEVAHQLGVGSAVDEVLDGLGVGPLSRAKAEYLQRLKEAMAQLTSEERAEIQNQYSGARKKIQAATTVAIAQWNWEWIREVIERIIEGREDDGMQIPVAPRSLPKKPGNWPPGRPRPPGD